MNIMKDILRGIFIGVANIVPGVSGGTIALSMGVYEKIIGAVNNFRKDFKGSIKILLPYIIGVVIGILVFAILIEFCLNKFPFPTVFAFIGLIIGGLPGIYSKVKNERFKITHLLSFILLALVIIIPTLVVGNSEEVVKNLELGFLPIIIMLVLGVITATSMVVPGVSGSMILMMLGYYETVLSKVSTCIKSVVALDIQTAFQTGLILVPFAIGVLVGILLAAKIIEKLLNKYPNATMWGIIALVVTSPFAILYGMSFETLTFVTAILSIITFSIGFIIAFKMSR